MGNLIYKVKRISEVVDVPAGHEITIENYEVVVNGVARYCESIGAMFFQIDVSLGLFTYQILN